MTIRFVWSKLRLDWIILPETIRDKVEGFGAGPYLDTVKPKPDGFVPNGPGPPVEPRSANADSSTGGQISVCPFAFGK